MKIYIDDKKLLWDFFEKHTTFLDFEEGKWQFVYDINDADIIPIAGALNAGVNIENLKKHYQPHQWIMFLDIFDLHETSIPYKAQELKYLTDKIVYVHKNAKLKLDKRFVFFDHLFYRQKLFCTDYNKIKNPTKCNWTRHCNPDIYRLGPIDKFPVKKFLSTIRLNHSSPGKYIKRKELIDYLIKSEGGHLGFPSEGKILGTNNDQGISGHIKESGGTWYPPADYYFNSSYVSIYTETLVNNYMAEGITEKTYDPLIKGNFILPFGYQGMIKQITNYGFKLPTWIDYSYDNIGNLDERFSAYLKSVDQVLAYTLEELDQFYHQDRSILEHNRNVFYSNPYESLYDLVYNFIYGP